MLGVVSLVSAACGGAGWQEKVESKIRNQAAFDLGCDAANVKLVQIEESAVAMGHMYTYGAQGCEKKATYKGMCASMGGCNAGLEGAVQTADAPAASATATPSAAPSDSAVAPVPDASSSAPQSK